MKAKRFYNGKGGTPLSALALGALVSLVILVLGSMALAKFLSAEWISEESVDYGIMAVLILASYIGAVIAYGKIRQRRLWVCLSVGGVFLLILLGITAMFFGGQYDGVGYKALLIFCGSMLAVLPGLRQNRGGKLRKLKIPNG